MSQIHGGNSSSAQQPGHGFRRGSVVDHGSRSCPCSGLRLLDGEARKSRPRGVRVRQGRRHTNHRQSSAIVQALPVLTTEPPSLCCLPQLSMQAGRCCGLREPAVRSRDLHFKPWPFEALPRQSRCPYLPISIRQSDLPEWPSLAATPRLRPSAEQPSCCSRQHRRQRRQPLEGSRSPLPV